MWVYFKRVRVYLMYHAPPKRFTFCPVICYFKSSQPHFPTRIDDTALFQTHASTKCLADVLRRKEKRESGSQRVYEGWQHCAEVNFSKDQLLSDCNNNVQMTLMWWESAQIAPHVNKIETCQSCVSHQNKCFIIKYSLSTFYKYNSWYLYLNNFSFSVWDPLEK